MSNQLAISDKFKELSTDLNSAVITVLNSETIKGFERAYTMAAAIKKLSLALTPEYMEPIMALQGNRLGFKTDKDKDGGYKEDIVKKCLIEAVLFGLQPTGNEFNIIAGNMYATKEGLGSLLKKFNGLSYELLPGAVNMNAGKDTAEATMTVKWMLNNAPQQRELKFAIKSNAYATPDAIIGKATRKARKWLHDTINGFEIPEGDASDVPPAPSEDGPIVLEDLQMLYDMKKEFLAEPEKKAAERILSNKEDKNYKRLHAMLLTK